MSFESLFRGLIGMIVLIILAYLLSNNRKQISWKLVIIGLIAQISIAIGVIKISVIKSFFGIISSFFVKILEYTNAGTTMLLGEFASIDKYGFIFVFQALPIIIFFFSINICIVLSWNYSKDCAVFSLVPKKTIRDFRA